VEKQSPNVNCLTGVERQSVKRVGTEAPHPAALRAAWDGSKILLATHHMLVIGYGNSLRSDDGVGPKVADIIEGLKLHGVGTLSCDVLTPELAEPIARADEVIFVDAAVDSPKKVRLRPLASADSSQIMAHAADPRTMLAVARDVFGHAPRAWWLTIPVENIGIGDKLSELAQQGLACAVEMIQKLGREPYWRSACCC